MTSPFPWWWLLFGCVAALVSFLFGRRTSKPAKNAALPSEWAVMPRPVLNSDERRTLRLLREALPQHIVLAKLPLVRLCQARDPEKVRFWYELLAPLHISFAVCSANGRVLAVIDLEPERGVSRRASRIKQAVLEVCRIRYLSCRAENLPPVSELQLLLRPQGVVSRPAPLAPLVPDPHFQQARSTLSDTVRSRRAERSERWADSGFPQDSFFAPDSRLEGGPSSEFAPLTDRGDNRPDFRNSSFVR